MISDDGRRYPGYNSNKMIRFINAKINIGLQIVRKREDGYHDLQTIFFPIGLYAGTAENPATFCDILELTPEPMSESRGFRSSELSPEVIFTGRKVDCPPEKNLVSRAASLFCEETGADFSGFTLWLEKHLPDGAGIGGGSADASFTLLSLAEEYNRREEIGDMSCKKITTETLIRMASRLGADCAFFILNRAAYAEGIGDRLEEISLDLSGYWLVAVKPRVYVSTAEAFAGVTPHEAAFDLRTLPFLPIEEWRSKVRNDFEDSVFPLHPEIKDVKDKLYCHGALYASMSGSGSSVYGIYPDEESAARAAREFQKDATIEGSYLLKL